MSVAICGSNESAARTIAWLAKPASASSAIARVGVGEAVADDKGGEPFSAKNALRLLPR
jgi:hypothetical protein